jgi:hypothetical protein
MTESGAGQETVVSDGFPITAALRDEYFTFLGMCWSLDTTLRKKSAKNSTAHFSSMVTSDSPGYRGGRYWFR